MLSQFLEERYEPGEPIILQDVIDSGLNYDNVCQQMRNLVASGKINRFMEGVYYIPKKDQKFFFPGLSSDAVAIAKYISRNGKTFGCYSGYSLANYLGLSNQVPFVKEISTNNSSAITRTVTIGKFSYKLRRAPVIITEENRFAVMLLEVLKDLDAYCDPEINAKDKLMEFIRKNHVAKKVVDELIDKYPLRTYKAIYDMELINVLA